MPTPPPLPDTLELLRLVWAFDHELHAASTRMQEQLGITAQQRLTLRMIEWRPGLSQSELAEALDLHASTVSMAVQRLVALGLCARVPDKKDARIVRLALTAAGRRTNAKAGASLEAALRRLMDAKGRAWRGHAVNVLRALTSAARAAGTQRKR